MRVLLVDVDPQRAGGATAWIDGSPGWRFDHLATRDPAALHRLRLVTEYDLIPIGTPRSDDPVSIAAVGVSDLVICPAGPSPTEHSAGVQSVQTVPPHVERRVLLTRIDGRSPQEATDVETSLDEPGIPRFDTRISRRKAHVTAQDAHVATHLVSGAPAATAGNDYRSLAAETASLLARQLATSGRR